VGAGDTGSTRGPFPEMFLIKAKAAPAPFFRHQRRRNAQEKPLRVKRFFLTILVIFVIYRYRVGYETNPDGAVIQIENEEDDND
jgi:hypothetical protein